MSPANEGVTAAAASVAETSDGLVFLVENGLAGWKLQDFFGLPHWGAGRPSLASLVDFGGV